MASVATYTVEATQCKQMPIVQFSANRVMVVCGRGHAYHVVCGHITLQTYGFPIQTYGKTSKCHNFNSKV